MAERRYAVLEVRGLPAGRTAESVAAELSAEAAEALPGCRVTDWRGRFSLYGEPGNELAAAGAVLRLRTNERRGYTVSLAVAAQSPGYGIVRERPAAAVSGSVTAEEVRLQQQLRHDLAMGQQDDACVSRLAALIRARRGWGKPTPEPEERAAAGQRDGAQPGLQEGGAYQQTGRDELPAAAYAARGPWKALLAPGSALARVEAALLRECRLRAPEAAYERAFPDQERPSVRTYLGRLAGLAALEEGWMDEAGVTAATGMVLEAAGLAGGRAAAQAILAALAERGIAVQEGSGYRVSFAAELRRAALSRSAPARSQRPEQRPEGTRPEPREAALTAAAALEQARAAAPALEQAFAECLRAAGVPEEVCTAALASEAVTELALLSRLATYAILSGAEDRLMTDAELRAAAYQALGSGPWRKVLTPYLNDARRRLVRKGMLAEKDGYYARGPGWLPADGGGAASVAEASAVPALALEGSADIGRADVEEGTARPEAASGGAVAAPEQTAALGPAAPPAPAPEPAAVLDRAAACEPAGAPAAPAAPAEEPAAEPHEQDAAPAEPRWVTGAALRERVGYAGNSSAFHALALRAGVRDNGLRGNRLRYDGRDAERIAALGALAQRQGSWVALAGLAEQVGYRGTLEEFRRIVRDRGVPDNGQWNVGRRYDADAPVVEELRRAVEADAAARRANARRTLEARLAEEGFALPEWPEADALRREAALVAVYTAEEPLSALEVRWDAEALVSEFLGAEVRYPTDAVRADLELLAAQGFVCMEGSCARFERREPGSAGRPMAAGPSGAKAGAAEGLSAVSGPAGSACRTSSE